MSKAKLPVRDKITLGLLVLMSFFLMCDMYITPGLVNELAAEYNVHVKTIGFVGSAFMLVGAFISIYFGYMSDKFSRKKLLVATVIIGEIPCFLTGLSSFTPTINSFFMLRVLTGIGVGGVFPLTFSLVSDYFTARHRAQACAWIDVAWGVGMMVGPMLAAFALETDYGWRMAFIIAAVPNFPIAIIFALYANDPKRGRTEDALMEKIEDGQLYSQKIKLSDFKIILKNRTNLLLFLQGIPGCIPWGILPFWIITFFETERNFTKVEATTLWEMFGIATTVGAVMWAIIGDKLFNKNPKYLPILCTVMIALGAVPCYIFINLPPAFFEIGGNRMVMYIAMASIAGIMISVASSNNKAIVMNVNRPEHRGSVFSIFNITDSIGKGVGPALGGLLVSSGYVFMMNFAISWWLLCAFIFSFMIFTISIDRKNLLLLLDERAEAM